MEENNNQIKVKLTTLISLILVVAIIIIVILFVIINNKDKEIDEGHDIGLHEFNTGNNENLLKNNDNITEDAGVEFINNEVLIMFNDNVKESRCEEIIKEINGSIISSVRSIDEYEVQVDYKFTTYSSIEQYCEMLEEKYDEIEMVSVNCLFTIDLN